MKNVSSRDCGERMARLLSLCALEEPQFGSRLRTLQSSFYTTGDVRDDWSYRCLRQNPRTEAHFFTLGPEDPPQPRLEQARISFTKAGI